MFLPESFSLCTGSIKKSIISSISNLRCIDIERLAVSNSTVSSSSRLLRRGGIANLVSSLVMATQSVVMLISISSVGTLAEAGVFTFGYANANLLINMGRFGMRNFQASDATSRFSFSEYRSSRFFTVGLMIASCALYLLVASPLLGYSVDKVATIFLLTLFKAEDAFEDVYQGDYQRNGRLDIAGIHLSIRLLLGLALFSAAMYSGLGLNTSLAIQVFFGLFYIAFEIWHVRRYYGLPAAKSGSNSSQRSLSWKKLIVECIPLFVMAFASFFTVNAPKYVIDVVCGDEEQAIFGYLFMPVFVVSLLANAVFQPQVSVLGKLRAEGKDAEFSTLLKRQMVYTALITVICVAGSVVLGPPILGALYRVDLSSCRVLIGVLMIGGGFYAASVVFMIGITILRAQAGMGIKYSILSVASLVLSILLIVLMDGILGACISYMLTMAMQLAVVYAAYRAALC